VAYTLIRGSVVDWYPYPFFNVGENGYLSVGLVSAGIAVLAWFFSWLLSLGSSDK
jgi:hypothetical protein